MDFDPGFGGQAIISFMELVFVLGVQYFPEEISETLIDLVLAGQVKGVQGARWFAAFSALSGGIGLLFVIAIVLCVLGKERTGFNYAYAGLLLELTAANLLAFYFDQFSTIFFALIQLILLVAIVRYQKRFLTEDTATIAS